MAVLTTFFAVTWIVFWVYWMISAAGAKKGTRPRLAVFPRLAIIALVILFEVVFKGHKRTVDNQVLHVMGLVLLLSGLGVAVWARVYLGRNWGMPMTRKDEPELVTTGPYQLVRHPIYSGLLLAMLGTALAITFYWFSALVVLGIYFIYSATVEEKIMAASFPGAYPSYRAKTKMLIPFVF
ncbi:MAG: methyltransferase family protein [Solirubrobacteraceae bacterium]